MINTGDIDILKYALQYGPFAALFVWQLIENKRLVVNQNKDSKKREEKLYQTIKENQDVIMELTKNLDIVLDIKSDVEEIKKEIKINNKVRAFPREDDK